MSAPFQYQSGHGTILAVHGVTGGKGPASGISYDVQIWTPNGPVQYSNIQPTHRRPPDVVDTIAAVPGDLIDYAMVASKVYFGIREFEDMAVCP